MGTFIVISPFLIRPALWASGRAASYPLHGKSAVGDKCDVGWVGTGSRNIMGKFDKKEKKKEKK